MDSSNPRVGRPSSEDRDPIPSLSSGRQSGPNVDRASDRDQAPERAGSSFTHAELREAAMIDVLALAERIEREVKHSLSIGQTNAEYPRTFAEARVIAAALRLAEEVHESCAELTMGGPRYHKFHGKRSPSVNAELTAYRAAKEADRG